MRRGPVGVATVFGSVVLALGLSACGSGKDDASSAVQEVPYAASCAAEYRSDENPRIHRAEPRGVSPDDVQGNIMAAVFDSDSKTRINSLNAEQQKAIDEGLVKLNALYSPGTGPLDSPRYRMGDVHVVVYGDPISRRAPEASDGVLTGNVCVTAGGPESWPYFAKDGPESYVYVEGNPDYYNSKEYHDSHP